MIDEYEAQKLSNQNYQINSINKSYEQMDN